MPKNTSILPESAALMVLQNFSQLDAAYGANDAETIRANANTHLLLPGTGLREYQYYSERIGSTTVPTWTRSRRCHAEYCVELKREQGSRKTEPFSISGEVLKGYTC